MRAVRALLLLALGLAPGGTGAPELSVLLLIADDLSAHDLAAYGHPQHVTPAIDRLASEGLVFETMYTPVALCKPSRACLATGLYPHKNGVIGWTPMNAGVRTWPDHLGAAGRFTGIVGKDVVAKIEAVHDFAERFPEVGRRTPQFYAETVERFLAAAEGRPFSLMINFLDPHKPGGKAAAAQYGELYEAEDDPRVADVWIPPTLADTRATRVELALHRERIERLDAAVASVLAVLERSGRAEDTLVLFLSDNGFEFPFSKDTLYEVGVRMPFIARWPGAIEAGTRSAAFASFVDVLPTCLAAAGADIPDGLDGRSFLPVLRGESSEHRSAVFGAHNEHRADVLAPIRSVRVGRYKYLRNFQTQNALEGPVTTGPVWTSMSRAARKDPALRARMARLVERRREELYDLEADPWELRDLAADPAHAETLASLRARLRAWMEAGGDPLLAEWGG
jgi:arylsulfatase A-like enzyme